MSRCGTGTAGAVAVVAGVALCCGVHLVAVAGGLIAVVALLPVPGWAAAAIGAAALLAAAAVLWRRRRGAVR